MIRSRHHLEARQVAHVIVAVEMNERFGGGHTELTSARCPRRCSAGSLPFDYPLLTSKK